MVAAIAADVTGPYALMGYSLGALVSFEATRLIHVNRMRPPTSLIVAAHTTPQVPWPHGPVSSGTDDEVVAYIRRYEGMPEPVMADPEFAAALMPVIRAGLRAMETYTAPPAEQLAVPLLAICGDADPTVSPAEMEAWRELTCESFRLEVVPGGHFFMHQSPSQTIDVVRSQLQLAAF